jgi:hypothetical protein
LQAGGHRFDPGRLHHPRLQSKRVNKHQPIRAAMVLRVSLTCGQRIETLVCSANHESAERPACLPGLAWSLAVCSSGPIGHIVSRNVPNSVGSWVWAKRPGHVVTPSVRSLRRSCLFFGNVNQVLVRLWARVTQGVSVVLGSWMDRRSRCSADLSDRELLLLGLNGDIRAINGAPTVGQRGFRGAMNDPSGWIFLMVAQAARETAIRARSCCVAENTYISSDHPSYPEDGFCAW